MNIDEEMSNLLKEKLRQTIQQKRNERVGEHGQSIKEQKKNEWIQQEEERKRVEEEEEQIAKQKKAEKKRAKRIRQKNLKKL